VVEWSKKLLEPLRDLTMDDIIDYYPTLVDRIVRENDTDREKWIYEIYPRELRGFTVYYIVREYFSWRRNNKELYSKEYDKYVNQYLNSINVSPPSDWARTNTQLQNVAGEVVKYEERKHYFASKSNYDIALEYMIKEWLPITRGCHILTLEEAVDLVDMTKSPGRPWTDQPYNFKTKGDMWKALGLEPHVQLREKLYNSIFTIYPKSMVAEIEKILNRKYRSFCVAPFPFHLNLLCFSAEFNYKLVKNPETQPVFVGFNEFEGGWHSWQTSKQHHGMSCYCFDISKCDSTVLEDSYSLENEVRWESFLVDERTDENRKIFNHLVWDMWYSYMWYGGFIIRKRGGNASGSTNTIETNSMHVFNLFIQSYLKWCRDNNQGHSYSNFKSHFDMSVCGDDCVFYTDLPALEIVTNMTEFGIQIKLESSVPRLWRDNTFCSRETIVVKYKGRLLMVARLSKEKLFASWCFGIRDGSLHLSYIRTSQLMMQAVYWPDLYVLMDGFLQWCVLNTNIQTAPVDALGYSWIIDKTVVKSHSQILELYHGF